MANGWQIGLQDPNTDVYVSKSGLPGGTGTRENPMAGNSQNLGQQGGDKKVWLGTGTYFWPKGNDVYGGQAGEGFAGGSPGSQASYFADGIVKFLGDPTQLFTALSFSGSTFEDIFFEQFGGFVFRGYIYSNAPNYRRCIFKVLPEYATTHNSGLLGYSLFEDCIFFNLRMKTGPTTRAVGYNADNNISEAVFNRCLFFNCVFESDVFDIKNSYIDSTCSIKTLSANNNNVDPQCNAAAGYGLSVNGAAFATASPNGISADPQFNSLVKEDFSLRKTSPHVTRGIGPAHKRNANTYFLQYLGQTGELADVSNTRLIANGSTANVPIVQMDTGVNGLEFNEQGGLIIRPNSNSNGFSIFTTGAIPWSDQPIEMTRMDPIAGLNFNSDFPALESQISKAAPHIFNNNVPDFTNGTSGSGARNPNRLSYQMRWSTILNPDINNPEHWVTGATFVEFAWGQKPLFNAATLIGNGNPNYNVGNPSSVFARYLQLKVCMRNDYFSK